MSCYQRAREPIIEFPQPFGENQGWVRTDEGLLEPLWSLGPVLPTTLVDILEKREADESVEEDELDEDLDVNEAGDSDED